MALGFFVGGYIRILGAVGFIPRMYSRTVALPDVVEESEEVKTYGPLMVSGILAFLRSLAASLRMAE